MTTISLHDVVAIALGPITHFPPSSNGGHGFWTRTIALTPAQGSDLALHTFAQDPGHLAVTDSLPAPCRWVTTPRISEPTPLSHAA